MPIVDDYLRIATDMGASDLHLKGGRPPLMRIQGELRTTDVPPLDSATLDDMFQEALLPLDWETFTTEWELDTAYRTEDGWRYRLNLFLSCIRGNGYFILYLTLHLHGQLNFLLLSQFCVKRRPRFIRQCIGMTQPLPEFFGDMRGKR